MDKNLLKSILIKTKKTIAKSFFIICCFLLFSNLVNAQSYKNHYIAPAPWVYFTEGNELIIATNSTAPVNITIKKSDGSTPAITPLNSDPLIVGHPKVYRFIGTINAAGNQRHKLNTVINDAGLIVIGDQPITVNLRNIVSDQDLGQGLDDYIKGNSSLFSFGDAAVGTSFRVGYYRDGDIYYTSDRPVRPIYSVMAINNGTILKINGVPIAILNAGQCYLFQNRIGSLVETSGPAVMNTSGAYDAPTGGNCFDGTSNPVPPVSSLGTQYIVVRGNGNDVSEQTTVVASEDNTVVTVISFTSAGAIYNTTSYTLAAAGDFVTFNNGVPGGTNAANTSEGQIYSATRILSTKKVAAYSGTADNCEVDLATLVPISDCTGSTKVQAYKFRKYTPADDLPYFAYIILNDPAARVYLTTDNGQTHKDIETLPGVGVRRQLGSSGLYIIDFNNANIANPNSITLESTSRLTVSMVQQGGGFSMSNFLTPLPEKALVPTFTQGDCASAVLSADPTSRAPFQWYLDGVMIPGATSINYTATVSGVYTVTTALDCGNSAQSLPITINLCNIDRAVTKTVDNATPVIGSTVNFTIKAKNLGPGNAINVVVTDLLPSGYAYVSSTTTPGTSYNNTTGKWIIGALAANGASTATLVVRAVVQSTGSYQNIATISGPQSDVTTSNDVALATPTVTVVPIITLTSASGTDAQTVCYDPSKPITPIVYTFGGTTTGAVANLPAGLTGTYTAATTSPVAPAYYTITGIPAVTVGPQTYKVTTQGGPNDVEITGSLTVNGQVTNPIFNTYTPTRCQGSGSVNYTATSSYATVITYSVSPAAAGTINATTGQMIWSAAFTGNATITATAAGCSGPKLSSIVINVSSGGTISPDHSNVCAVNNIGVLTANGVSGTIIRWEYSTDAGITWIPIANTASTQNYSALLETRVYRVVSQTPACAEVYSAIATITVSQIAVVSNQTATVCSGNSFLVEPSGVPGGTVYSWSAPTVLSGAVTGGSAGSNLPNITGTLSGNGIVRYTVTPRSGSCEAAAFTITVTVSAPTVRTINYGGAYCKAAGGTASPIFGGTTTGIVSSTFSSTIGLSIDVNTGVVDIAASQAGNYLITNTYSNGSCTSTATYVLVLGIAPTTGAIVAPADICANSKATIAFSNIPNGNGTFYTVWDAPTGGTNLGTVPFTTPNLSANTTYYIQPTNSCGDGTRTPIEIKISSSTLATPITSGTSAICEGSTLQLANATIGGAWGSSNTAIATINSSGLLSALAPGSVVISYVTPTGCTSKTLTIDAKPSISPITGTGDLCIGSNRTFANATPGGTWSSSNITVATINSIGEVSGVAAGTAVITYTTAANANGCTNSTSYTTTVNSPSTLVHSGGAANQIVCSGSAITDIVYTYGGSATSVFVTGTISPANYIINTTNNTVTITGSFNSSVTYNVTTIGHTSPCDPIVLSGTITANAPTATISGTAAVCRNVTSPAITFTGANGTAPYTFTYDINGGTPLTITTTSGNSVTVNAPTTTVGSFVYHLLSVKDASPTACASVATGSATITVNNKPQGVNATTIVDCAGQLTYSLQNNIVNGIASTFSWTVVTSGNVVGAVAGSGNTINQTLQNTSTTVQTVTYSVTPKATGVGTCDGNIFTVIVTIPVCTTLSATNDNGTVNGLTGGTAVANILVNDTYKGNSATVNNVTISQISTSNPKVTIDPLTGKVNVAAGTPAGTYTLVYQIEDKLDPTQKKTATVTVIVTAPAIIATDDSGTINGVTGGTAIINILANDTYNGNPATINDVTISQISSSSPNVTIDPATGKVNVAPNTPSGTYTLVYEIEDKLNPGQKKQATITVNVTSGTLTANPDTGTILGFFGGTIQMNILGNDTYNGGSQATVGNVIITQVSTDNPKINIDPTNGKVIVQPRTLPGVYVLTYQITDKLDPTNKATTTVTITIPNWITDLTVTKTANKKGVEVNENITYTITVTNNGTATVLAGRAIVLTESLPVGLNNVTYAAKGGIYSPTANTFTTAADLDAGQSVFLTISGTIDANYAQSDITNSVTVNAAQLAMDPNLNNNTASVTSPILRGKITLVKEGVVTADGNEILYTFTVKNTGAVTLNNIILTDSKIWLNDLLIGVLTPGSSTTYSKAYKLTQSEKDLGLVTNTATVSSKSPAGNNITDISGTAENNDNPTVILIAQNSAMTLTKTANNTGIKAGDVINYTLIAKNTGNTTLTNVAVTDAGADAGSILPANIPTLEPGEMAVVAAKHTITQAEINTGRFSNQASVIAKDPKNIQVTDPLSDDPNTTMPDDPTVVLFVQNADLVTVKKLKSAAQVSYIPGDEVVYLINVKNAGPNAATNVTVTDIAPLGTTISKWTATSTGLTLPNTSGNGNLAQTIALFPSNSEANYEVTVKTSNGSTKSIHDGQPLSNTVTVTSSTQDLSTVGDITTTPAIPAVIQNDLSIVKVSDHLTPVGIDMPYDYNITVKNKGFFTSNNIVVTDILPAGLSYVSHTASKGTANFSTSTNTVVWTVPTIESDAIVTLTIKVKASKAGLISNTAVVQAAAVDPNLANNTSTDLKEIFALNTKPNVITPNGDGKNDTFVIDGLALYPDNFLTIFNRWGNEVFHSNGGYKNDWGGNGLKEGTYYYLLKVKDTSGNWSVSKGYITLLRNN